MWCLGESNFESKNNYLWKPSSNAGVTLANLLTPLGLGSLNSDIWITPTVDLPENSAGEYMPAAQHTAATW